MAPATKAKSSSKVAEGKKAPAKATRLNSASSRGGKAPKAASKSAAAVAVATQEHKLRIRVRAYEHKILDVSVKSIMDTAARLDAKIVGPVPLPTEIKRWTVNRSTFVHKDAREQFEMRIHKRLIDILNPSQKVVEALTNLNLPSGVTIDVKMV